LVEYFLFCLKLRLVSGRRRNAHRSAHTNSRCYQFPLKSIKDSEILPLLGCFFIKWTFPNIRNIRKHSKTWITMPSMPPKWVSSWFHSILSVTPWISPGDTAER
jgi:hypothetical protein